MRIISGSARGLKLLTLDGDDTRPTLDRVKEALFSMLLPYIYGSTVLDLFAGSGALGLETLSRGGKKCILVDKNISCKKIILKNIENSKMKDKCTLIVSDYKKFISECNEKFSLVFLDPPYALAKEKMSEILKMLLSYDILLKDAIVSVEVLKGTTFEFDGYELLKNKSYGKVEIFVLKKA